MSTINFSPIEKRFIDDYLLGPDHKVWADTENRTLKRIKKKLKDYYLSKQNFTCAYCRQQIFVRHNSAWDLDHVISKASHEGFMFEVFNLCISCKDCNLEKLDFNVLVGVIENDIPMDSGDYLIVHPNIDEYSDHIEIIGNYEFYKPITKKGKYTTKVCGLTRFIYRLNGISIDQLALHEKIARLNDEAANSTCSIRSRYLCEMIKSVIDDELDKAIDKELRLRGMRE